MYKLMAIARIGILTLALPLLSARSATELLQKGIYTQETVGDLDAAIRIYQQVIALSADARAQGAQAQYRLGLCLARKGSQAEATKAFEKLIADYPEQKDLVSSARQHMPVGLKLLAPPWTEGEMLRLKLKLPTGLTIGMLVQTIEKSSGGTLVMTTRTYAGGPAQFSRTEVDLDTLRPRSNSFRHAALGDYKLTYNGRQAQVQANGKEARSMEIPELAFDNGSALALMRRLPLAEGYTAKLDIVSPIGNGVGPFAVEVTGIEEVETPAGKFRAFKLEWPLIRQTFWISTDARRYIVKMEADGLTGELEEAGRLDAPPFTYRDPSQNISVILASPWLIMPVDSPSDKPGSTFAVMDPEVRCNCKLWAGAMEGELRSETEQKIGQRAKEMKNYTVRPDSWRTRQIGGVEALTVLADFENNKVPSVEQLTVLKQDKRAMVFFARVPAAHFAAIQPQFEKIVESARFQ